MLHPIRFSFHDEEMRIRELKNLGLDGILWRVFNTAYPSREFMKQVLASGIALAVVSDRIYPGIPQVHLSTEEAEQKLFRHLKKPDRVFQIANTGVITLADALIRKWGLPEKAVRRIGKGKVFQETMEEFREIIRSEKPDLLFCDTLYAETLPPLCEELGIDCEFITDNEVNHTPSHQEYAGWSTIPDAEQAARAAAGLLLNPSQTTIVIQNKLKKGGRFV